MAATAKDDSQNEQIDDISASATEGMLGPNPFVGLRPCDILATAQQIGAQAVRQPALLVEQEAALVRNLLAVLGGNAKSAHLRATSVSQIPRGRTTRGIAWRCRAIWCGATR